MIELERPPRISFEFTEQNNSIPCLDIRCADKLIGHISYGASNKQSEGIPLCWRINSQYQGKGIMKQALNKLLRNSRHKLFQACILESNLASIALAKSCGFVQVGTFDHYDSVALIFEYRKF